MESFNIYGEKTSMEWHMEKEDQLLFRMGPVQSGRTRPMAVKKVKPPQRPDLLPNELAYYITHQADPDPNNPHQSIESYFSF
jgi:hypothetical protein